MIYYIRKLYNVKNFIYLIAPELLDGLTKSALIESLFRNIRRSWFCIMSKSKVGFHGKLYVIIYNSNNLIFKNNYYIIWIFNSKPFLN